MNEHPEHSGHADHAEHIDSVKTYALILIALLILTIATALVATIDLGPLNIIVALAIAVTKMMLVVLFFMHVRYSTRLTRLVL
ncbi:MAG: cytochrome C oxidase subunit IV family protein, partial [Acidobacteriia bacterium]|nr:cytochrome C oxidase subunit IV family protein [Terriglobia bacterium]